MLKSPEQWIVRRAGLGVMILLSAAPCSMGWAAGETAGAAPGGASQPPAYTNRLIDSNDPGRPAERSVS